MNISNSKDMGKVNQKLETLAYLLTIYIHIDYSGPYVAYVRIFLPDSPE